MKKLLLITYYFSFALLISQKSFSAEENTAMEDQKELDPTPDISAMADFWHQQFTQATEANAKCIALGSGSYNKGKELQDKRKNAERQVKMLAEELRIANIKLNKAGIATSSSTPVAPAVKSPPPEAFIEKKEVPNETPK